MIGLQPVQPLLLVWPRQAWSGLLRESEKIDLMPPAPIRVPLTLCQPALGILPYRFQQPVSRPSLPLLIDHQALLHQGSEQVEDLSLFEGCGSVEMWKCGVWKIRYWGLGIGEGTCPYSLFPYPFPFHTPHFHISTHFLRG